MKVIVAPLNWGLGHASRCIPIVRQLIDAKFQPIIASDGVSLTFLRKEFPNLDYLELPSYDIKYGKYLKTSLLKQIFKIRKTSQKEHKVISNFIKRNENLVGIISDNRFGVYSTELPSVYISHQINVLSGVFTYFTSLFHRKIINKFDECWVPDEPNHSLTGKLATTHKLNIPVKFIGNLSRFQQKEETHQLDITVLLSGPEPNRSIVEKSLRAKFSEAEKRVLLIQGVVEDSQVWSTDGNLKVVNFMLSKELESTLNSSKRVVCRSGYSTIMDLSVLQKELIVIPTKGQTEQEYLANYHSGAFQVETLQEHQIQEFDFFKRDIPKLPKTEIKIEQELFSLFKGK